MLRQRESAICRGGVHTEGARVRSPTPRFREDSRLAQAIPQFIGWIACAFVVCRIRSTRMPEPMLTVAQVAEQLNTTRWFVYHRLAYAGKLPYYKIGGVIRFDPGDVEAYRLASRRGGGPAT